MALFSFFIWNAIILELWQTVRFKNTNLLHFSTLDVYFHVIYHVLREDAFSLVVCWHVCLNRNRCYVGFHFAISWMLWRRCVCWIAVKILTSKSITNKWPQKKETKKKNSKSKKWIVGYVSTPNLSRDEEFSSLLF